MNMNKKALVITTIPAAAIVGATFLPHDADASEIAHSTGGEQSLMIESAGFKVDSNNFTAKLAEEAVKQAENVVDNRTGMYITTSTYKEKTDTSVKKVAKVEQLNNEKHTVTSTPLTEVTKQERVEKQDSDERNQNPLVKNETETTSDSTIIPNNNETQVTKPSTTTTEEKNATDKKETVNEDAFNTSFNIPNDNEISNVQVLDETSKQWRQLTHEEAMAYNPLHHVNTQRNSLILDAIEKEKNGDPDAWLEYRKFSYKQAPYNFEIVNGKPVYNKFYYGKLFESALHEKKEAELNKDEKGIEIWNNAMLDRLESFKKAPGQVPYIVGLNHLSSTAKEYGVEEADKNWTDPELLWIKERKMWWDNPIFKEQPELLDKALRAAIKYGTDISGINRPANEEIQKVTEQQ
ncbi:hypothetical protein FOA22_13555 [Heyndrickxia oleronia]|uniref:hypothetical protein n=1 Tax=Heyndrickxia oleronia TaxID=38875 RepID=UPI0033377DE9